jgi:hypothetical protein
MTIFVELIKKNDINITNEDIIKNMNYMDDLLNNDDNIIYENLFLTNLFFKNKNYLIILSIIIIIILILIFYIKKFILNK